ncbi:beta family protein [Micromonospora tarapacensis]|uniref:beta family protein n=1 Tax=Micromonospora tarapacensis TaxID=2835305 RepID=UPI001E4D3B6B|nr:beta family protein [Micromonospora tarapacensis]
MAALGFAARAHARRAVVRLRVRQHRTGPDTTTVAVERIWRYGRLAPEQCDLLIDCGDVCCAADVRAVEPRVRRALGWARRYAWRSASVVAGGMPATRVEHLAPPGPRAGRAGSGGAGGAGRPGATPNRHRKQRGGETRRAG